MQWKLSHTILRRGVTPRSQVAGAAAEAGLSAAQVAAEARAAAERTGTMGVALTTCALPGGSAPARLGPAEIEMGLGIHGEPGAAVRALCCCCCGGGFLRVSREQPE